MLIIDNPKIVSYNNAILLLNENVLPVIFWDTCTLLDIMRIPLNSADTAVGRLRMVLALKQKIKEGKIKSFASVLTIKELNDNINRYKLELFNKASLISQEHNNMIALINVINPTNNAIPDIDLNAHNIEYLLLDTITSITDETIFVDRDDEFLKIAEHRVIEKIGPARVKGEFKDAYIWATCFKIRENSSKLSEPFIFNTSNINDYAAVGKNNIDTDIKVDADRENIIVHFKIEQTYKVFHTSGLLNMANSLL